MKTNLPTEAGPRRPPGAEGHLPSLAAAAARSTRVTSATSPSQWSLPILPLLSNCFPVWLSGSGCKDYYNSVCSLYTSTLTWILHFFFFFFPFIFISCRLITSQHFSGFCHTLTWISHAVTYIPHPNPPSHLPLHQIPLGLPSAPGPSTCLMHPTWAGDLFHYRYYTCWILYFYLRCLLDCCSPSPSAIPPSIHASTELTVPSDWLN